MSEFKHTFFNNTLGEITFSRPYRFTYYYDDGTFCAFDNVKTVQAMKTGCYILFTTDGKIIVIPPKHRYCVEEPMP